MDSTTTQEVEKLENLKGYALMDEVLKYQPAEIKRKVRWLVDISGIRPDDPLFLMLLVGRINQVLFEKVPSDIEISFDAGRTKIAGTLEEYLHQLTREQEAVLVRHEKAALSISEAKINQAIDRILAENDLHLKGRLSAKAWATLLTSLFGCLVFGVGGIGGYGWAKMQLQQEEATYLSREELNLLEWAKSKEGQLAKNLVSWNEDLVNQECQKKVEALNVTISIGTSKAQSGYCWIWTVPPQQRTFIAE